MEIMLSIDWQEVVFKLWFFEISLCLEEEGLLYVSFSMLILK